MSWQIIFLVIGLALVLLGPSVGRSIKLRLHSTKRNVNRDIDVAPAKELEFRGKPQWLKISWIDLIYGVSMLVGILAKELWDAINDTGQIKIRPSRAIGALIVSPIVYAGVYSSFSQGQVNLLGLAIAFQNGFFWQAVFRTAQASTNTGDDHTTSQSLVMF